MDLAGIIPRFLSSRAGGLALSLAGQLLHVGPLRRAVVRLADGRLQADLATEPRLRQGLGPLGAEQKLMALAALHTVDRLVQRGFLSPHVTRVISRLWGQTLSGYISGQRSGAAEQFFQTHGNEPPRFLAISPTQACNLRCRGCYACSDAGARSAAHMDWALLGQVMTQARRLWDARLFVFSGGEPLLYRSSGKTILDLVEQHPDCLFLMFTNGTMIDRQVAQRMARLGNLTPAISVEGLRERTDARRGDGVFDQALAAMALLREAGVPFGISVTVTTANHEEVLSDEFVDLFFDELGAFYGFLFQYMPIGRWQEMDGESMPTPQQRLALWRRQWQVITERHAFLFDFWNSGALVHGCLSAGRDRGYLYIDWNGKVMPCVFVPYAVADLHEVFARGGTLDDVYEEPLLQTMRAWQREYGFEAETLSADDDWLRPCPIRDHYARFREWVAAHEPEPADQAALEALNDPLYYERLAQYDRELEEITGDVWAEEYVGSCGERMECFVSDDAQSRETPDSETTR
jgi:MoaA/NifB/PqqE/SkfB family radical SAM enzyme